MVMKISKVAGAGYYMSLAKASYYEEEGEAKGIWYGRGAKHFNLSGEVDNSHFLAMYRGFTPKGRRPMVQNAGDENRVAGWDMTFSPPKSVSVLWGTADKDTRAIIEQAFEESVKEVLDIIEREFLLTRRGRNGLIKEEALCTFALFKHSANRNDDPLFHIHAVGFNSCVRQDGTFGALEPRRVFAAQKYAGALVRSVVANKLQCRLGLQVERVGDHFELLGRNEKACEEWSSRTREIKQEGERTGFTSYLAERFHNLTTRRRKGEKELLSRSEYFSMWEAQGEREFGIGRGQGLSHHDIGIQKRRTPQELYKDIIEELTDTHATFDDLRFREVVAIHTQTENYTLEETQELTERIRERLIPIPKTKERYTTREHLIKELNIAGVLEDSKGRVYHPVEEELVERAIVERQRGEYPLSDEQIEALRGITSEQTGSISVIQGLAGVGKTYGVLKEATRVFEDAGYSVVGVAPTGKSARGLKNAGIKDALTLHSLLYKQRAYEAELEEIRETGKEPHELYEEKRAAWKKENLGVDESKKEKVFKGKYEPSTYEQHAELEKKGKISEKYRKALDKRLAYEEKEKRHRQEHPEFYDEKGRRMNHPRGGYYKDKVIITDEGGMCGTDLLEEHFHYCQKYQATNHLVGDKNQTSSVNAGGAFIYAQGTLKPKTLVEVIRQTKEEDREALKEFATDTNPNKLVETFDISYCKTPKGAYGKLFREWRKQELEGERALKESVMLTETRAAARTLNQRAQKERQKKGQLGEKVTKEISGYRFYTNERILFRHNHKDSFRGYDLKNGDSGTVLEVPDKKTVVVQLDDDGSRQTVDLEAYHKAAVESGEKDISVELGYASTTDAKQGASIERVYGYTGERTAKEYSYTLSSRHIQEVKLYTIKETTKERLEREAKERQQGLKAEKGSTLTEGQIKQRFKERLTRETAKQFALLNFPKDEHGNLTKILTGEKEPEETRLQKETPVEHSKAWEQKQKDLSEIVKKIEKAHKKSDLQRQLEKSLSEQPSYERQQKGENLIELQLPRKMEL